jgi:hypothetical protein
MRHRLMDRLRLMADVKIRYYPGPTFAAALLAYEADLSEATASGWYPVATVWGWDAVFSAGVLVGGSHWTPGDGVLAVTYRREGPEPQTSSS